MRIYKNGRNTTGQSLELAVEGQKFADVGPDIDEKLYPGCEVVDLGGRLVIPPYVEPHIHLDYAYSYQPRLNPDIDGTLFAGIRNWSEIKKDISADVMKKRAWSAISKQIGYGVQYVRTHVDVTDPELKGLHTMQELQKEVAPYIELQIVAFPQEGMYAYPDGAYCVEEALKQGAEVVGAIPHCEYTSQSGRKSVTCAFDLAEKYGCMVDIHCDEIDDPNSRFVEDMAMEAIARGYGEKTCASHTCAMGSYDVGYVRRLLGTLKKSAMNFIVCPAENLHLQGRGDSVSRRRGVTRVQELMNTGLNVCFGQDSIMDPWYPLGSGNLMNILDFGLHVSQLTDPEHIWNGLDMITYNGARAIGIPEERYGIGIGKPANFLVLDASSAYEAICLRSRVLRSVRNGAELFVRESDRLEVRPLTQGGGKGDRKSIIDQEGII